MERQAMNATKREQDVHGSCSWRHPPIISDLPTPVEFGCNSTEKETQRTREQSVLQALYFTKEMIPDSAGEPELADAGPSELSEPKVIPLHDKTGGGETFVDHSNTPMPKPGGVQPLKPTPPSPAPANSQFSLPPDIASILGNMAHELTSGRVPQPTTPAPFSEGIQQMLNNILDQNPAAAKDENVKAQLRMMMESGPIRDQIQAWASGQPTQGAVNWGPPPPPPPPPPHTGPPSGGLLPHPNIPPASMLNGPPMHGPPRGNPHFPGGWGRGGPPPPRGHMIGPHRGHRGGRGGPHRGRAPPRTLCKRFPNCSFGKDCKFLHPGENGPPV